MLEKDAHIAELELLLAKKDAALREARRFLDYFAHNRTDFVGGGTPISAIAQIDAALAPAAAPTTGEAP